MKKLPFCLSILFWKIVLFWPVDFLAAQPSPPKAIYTTDLALFQQTIDDYMQENKIPALVAGIVRDGKVEAFICKGTMQKGSDRPVNENTLFQLASLSKAFTGMLANELIAERKLDPEASIIKYLPADLPAATREKLAPLSVRNVLHHRSGLPRDADNGPDRNFGLPMKKGYTEAEMLENLNLLELKFAPDERWSYSNFGYSLMGYIMESVSGKSYETLLQNYIAAKFGMPNTTTVLNDQQEKALATPYRPEWPRVKTNAWKFGKLAPAGGIFSTVSDLTRLMTRQMAAYDQFQCTGAVSPLILTQYKKGMGRNPGYPYYGFGLIESQSSLDTTIIQYSHGGDVDGFVSNFSFAPARGVGLVLLSSQGGAWFWEMERQLQLQLWGFPVREAVTVSRQVLKRYEGDYDFGDGQRITLQRKGLQLISKRRGYPSQKLYAASERVFFFRSYDAQFEFILNDQGAIEDIVFTQDGKTVHPKQVK